MPQTVEAIFLIFFIIIPGYFIREIKSFKIPRHEQSELENILDYIVLGFINLFIFSFTAGIIIYIIGERLLLINVSGDLSIFNIIIQIIKSHIGLSIITGLLYFFGFPILIGFLFGKREGKKINPFPSAWDEFFTKTKKVSIYIQLKSGEKICGVFGIDSRASSNPKQRDIYLENELILDDNGILQGLSEPKTGIWINKDEISNFRVFPYYIKEEESNEYKA